MAISSPTAESRQLAGVTHILGILTNFLAPLIVWLLKQETDAYVARHAKESLNFQITVAIAYGLSGIASVVLFPIWWLFGWAVNLAIVGINIWWSVKAYQATVKGDEYRYSFALRFVS